MLLYTPFYITGPRKIKKVASPIRVQIYVSGLDLHIISPTRVKGDRAQFILTDHNYAIDILFVETHIHTQMHTSK